MTLPEYTALPFNWDVSKDVVESTMVSDILMACLLETLQRSRVSRVVYLMLSECAMISRVDVTSHSYQES